MQDRYRRAIGRRTFLVVGAAAGAGAVAACTSDSAPAPPTRTPTSHPSTIPETKSSPEAVATSPADPKPAPDNTGPSSTAKLTSHAGDYMLRSGSISGLHISGDLYLAGNDVAATDCRVDGSVFMSATTSKSYAIPPLSGQALTRVSTRGVWCTGTAGMSMEACSIGPSADTDMQLSAYQPSGDNPYLNAEDITIKDSYFYPPKASTGKRHLQAVHLMGCHRVLFEHCTFDYVAPDLATQQQTTAAFFVQAYPKESHDVTLRDCWFFGGGYYQISIDSTPGMTVQGCKFHSFTGTGGGPGATQYPPKSGAYPVTASDNTLDGQDYAWIQP